MRPVIVTAVVAAFTLAAACSVDVDITNKRCPCGSGYVCDTARNVCVTPATLKATASKPACDPCPCTTSADCTDPTRSVCAATSKTCVECDPANDTCATGTYCNAKSQCTAGCKTSADCAKISPASPLCAEARHQCVTCLTTKDCTGADQTCSPSGACVASCGVAKPCAGGATCCATLCVDTTQDPLNCGACGAACTSDNGTATCAASKCATTCANGFTHCGTGNTGCETNTRTDANNCGGCGNVCSATLQHVVDPTCADGACTFTQCVSGYADFDSNKANGCETACGTKSAICCPNRTCIGGLSCNGGGRCN